MRYMMVLVAALLAWAAFHSMIAPVRLVDAQMTGMPPSQNLVPPVQGFYNGKEVWFVHTEASDRGVAEMLTMMMGPKVLVVPGLAKVPKTLLADVYVFTNGIKGSGPFGFQADVFNSIPGQPNYTPLRAVTLATWGVGAKSQVLRSVDEIRATSRAGHLALKQPGVVVNMPMLIWPGGSR